MRIELNKIEQLEENILRLKDKLNKLVKNNAFTLKELTTANRHNHNLRRRLWKLEVHCFGKMSDNDD